jgi:hypothetical protein
MVCLVNIVHRQATVRTPEADDKFALLATTDLLEIKKTFYDAGEQRAVHIFERDVCGGTDPVKLQILQSWSEEEIILHLQYGSARINLMLCGTGALDISRALFNWLTQTSAETWPDHMASFFEGIDPFRTPNKFRELLFRKARSIRRLGLGGWRTMALLLRCSHINNADAIRLRDKRKLRILHEFMFLVSLPWVHIGHGDAQASLSAPKTAAEFLVILVNGGFAPLGVRNVLGNAWGLEFGTIDRDGKLDAWSPSTTTAALASIASICCYFFSP